MRYLLDTHVFIWAIVDRSRLPMSILNEISDEGNEVFISAISYWEIALKFSLGKLQIAGFKPHELPSLATEMGFESIPLTIKESSTIHFLKPTFHRDPFDKMLIWQAIGLDLTLVTQDETIHKYEALGLKTFW